MPFITEKRLIIVPADLKYIRQCIRDVDEFRRRSESRRVAASRKIKENGAVSARGSFLYRGYWSRGSSSIVYLRVPSVVSRAVPGRRFSRCQRRRIPRESPRIRKTKAPEAHESEFRGRFSRTTRIIHPTIIHNIMNGNYSSSFRSRHAHTHVFISPSPFHFASSSWVSSSPSSPTEPVLAAFILHSKDRLSASLRLYF